MSAGAIEAGRAFVRLLLNDKELSKGLTKAQNRLKVFAASTGQLGRQMLSLSAAIAAPGVAGAKAFMDFERHLAEVATMLDNPQKFMSQFTESVKRLAVEFGESTDTLAKGLYDILSASIPPAQAMDVLTASVRAAKAGLSDTGTAADAITTVLNAYQMSANRAADVSDWMFADMKRGKTTFIELAPNIGKVATIAATAGVELNELGAMLAVLTRNGISTDEAVTSLNAIISTFLKPTAEAQQLAKQLGFDLSSTAIQAEGLGGVFKRIASLPPDAIAKLFPNVRALKGVLPALRNLEGFADDMELLSNAAGMTAEAHKKMADTIGETFNKIKQVAIRASVEIGTALAADLKKGANAIKGSGEYVTAWVEDHQSLVSVLGKSAVAIGALAGGLLALSVAAKTAAWAIGGVALAGKAAGVSLTFLAAHPAIAVLAGLAVAVTALGVKAGFAAQETFRLAEAQQGLLESGEKKRRQDMDLLDRLQHLSSMQRLSAKQMDEARAIIRRLQSTYGDLGITLDETTGKLTGMAEAYERTSVKMREARWVDLKAAMMEAQANQQFLANQLQELHGKRMDPVSRSVIETDLFTKAQEWKAKENALLAKFKAEFGQDSPEVAGPKGSYEAAIQQDLAAAQNAADFQKKLDERMHQARLAMIEDEQQRELEAIRAKHMAEREEAKNTGRDLGKLLEIQAAEVGVIHAEHRRKQKDEEEREDERRTQNQKDLQEEIEDLTIRTQYEGLDQQLQLIEVQRKRAIAEAKTLGLSVDDVNKKFDLMADLARKDVVPEVEQKTSVAGTFSAQMAARMGGSVEEKQLKAQQEIVTHTKRTAEAVSALGRLGS